MFTKLFVLSTLALMFEKVVRKVKVNKITFNHNLKEGLVIGRGGSRTAATSKMERFVIIVNGWKPLVGTVFNYRKLFSRLFMTYNLPSYYSTQYRHCKCNKYCRGLHASLLCGTPAISIFTENNTFCEEIIVLCTVESWYPCTPYRVESKPL